MKRLFNLVFLTLLHFFALAQSGKTVVNGLLKDTEGKPLQAATIALVQLLDGKTVRTVGSDTAGRFSLPGVAAGNYHLQVTAIGYDTPQPYVLKVKAGQETLVATVPPLSAAVKSLGGVVVQSKLKMVETKADKTVVNVDAMLSNAGSSALDVLEKSPGVLVDKDGNISLKGKQGVIIMMDGKPTYLGGQDLANYLRNLPSNQLEQLEIMTQPSAKYDAAGNSGIINIRTKKSRLNGFNGSVSTSYIQGIYPKTVHSLGLNWRKNKMNVFANYSYAYWHGFGDLYLHRRFQGSNGQPATLFDQRTNNQRIGRSNNLKAGMDYTLDKNTTIGAVVTGTYDPRSQFSTGATNILAVGGQVDSINKAQTNNRERWQNLGINLNIRKVLGKSREWTADADYIIYRSSSHQQSLNTMLNAAGTAFRDPFLLNGNLPGAIDIYSFKSDYVQPLGKTGKLEAGIKTSLVRSDNNAIYTIYDHPAKGWLNDTTRSNHFLYDENINAAYVNYSQQLNKWSIQAGLRLENTNGKGTQLIRKSTFTRHYTQLFPTFYLSRELSDKHSFTLSYGRRINRPNYQDLNPFIYFLDQYTYNQGNPYLMPQFSHNIEMSHSFKGQLVTTVSFSRTSDIINDILVQNDSTKVTYQTKQNIARQNNFGLSVSYNAPLTKWYTISLYGNGFINQFSGIVNNRQLDVKIPSFILNINNQFRFKGGWGAEASGWFRSKTQDAGVIVSEPMGGMNFAFSKQLLHSKGTLKLGMNDPFYIQRFNGYTRFGNIDATIRSISDSRRFSLNFTYRFGKAMQQQSRRRTNSTQDEQNRVGGSSNG